MEQWKSIKGYEGLYEVSSEGNVKSFKCVNKNGRILKPQITPQGYAVYRLYDDANQYKQYSGQKLVCDAFLGEIDDNSPILMDRDHIDGNRANNRLENLQIISHLENTNKIDHSFRFKAVEQYTKDGVLVKTYESLVSAKEFGYTPLCISRVTNGKQKYHKGFIWKVKK